MLKQYFFKKRLENKIFRLIVKKKTKHNFFHLGHSLVVMHLTGLENRKT